MVPHTARTGIRALSVPSGVSAAAAAVAGTSPKDYSHRLMAGTKLELYMHAVADTFVRARAQVKEALNLIGLRGSERVPPVALQLLALRRYLRIGDRSVEANWSWSEEEARRQEQQEPGKTLYQEARKVQDKFARENPGYTLAISPIRSLEKQVRLWNENTSIHQAGMKLVAMMTKELAKAAYPEAPNAPAIAMFRQSLGAAMVTPEPTNAAPGTSDHGRATAVDFVVMRGGTPIASTKMAEVATRWKHDGWEAKLIRACAESKLRGPLQKPYEPWHWVLQR